MVQARDQRWDSLLVANSAQHDDRVRNQFGLIGLQQAEHFWQHARTNSHQCVICQRLPLRARLAIPQERKDDTAITDGPQCRKSGSDNIRVAIQQSVQYGAHCRGIPKLAECRQGTIADHGQCVMSMFIQDSQDFRVLRVSQFDQRLPPCDVVLVIEDIGGFQLLANFSELRGGELAGGSRRGIVWNRPFGRRLNHLLQALVVERSSDHGGLGRWILGRRRRWSLRSGHGRWSVRNRSGMTSATRGVVRRDWHCDGRRTLWALHSLAS